jgi:hypothetical protein
MNGSLALSLAELRKTSPFLTLPASTVLASANSVSLISFFFYKHLSSKV